MKRFLSIPLSLLLVQGLIFGSSYMLIKRGLQALSPIQIAALRAMTAGIVLFPLAVIGLKKVSVRSLQYIAIVGLLGTGLASFLYALGQTHIPSALAGTLNSTPPLWVLLLGTLFFHLSISRRKVLSLFFGFIGVVFMLFSGEVIALGTWNYYGLFVLLAGFLGAINILLIKEKLYDVEPISIPAISLLFLLPFSTFIVVSTGIPNIAMSSATGLSSTFHIMLLGLLINVIGNILFIRLIQITDAAYASILHFLIPLVATLWGVLDGEALGWKYFGGMSLIIIGLIMATKKNRLNGIRIEQRSPTVKEYQRLSKSVGWHQFNEKAIRRGLRNTIYALCVLYEEEIIATGRIVGDSGMYYYIQDIIVHPEYQNQGFGDIVMRNLMEFLEENTSTDTFIGLMAAEGAKEFYTQYGFQERKGDSPGMAFEW